MFGTETAKDEAECPTVVSWIARADTQSYYKRTRLKIKRSIADKNYDKDRKEAMTVHRQPCAQLARYTMLLKAQKGIFVFM